jgi:hypothetical protein
LARVCVFCGSDDLSVEHVLAKWVYKTIPGHGRVTHARAMGTVSKRDLRRWEAGNKVELRTKRVCVTCNTSWLYNLEGDAEPILAPMVRGDPFWIQPQEARSLTRDEQSLVALWACKTMLLLDLTSALTAMPDEHRRWVYEHREPPQNTWVWLTSFTGPAHYSNFATLPVVDDQQPAGTEPEGYLATLSVGHLVFQIMSAGKSDLEANIGSAFEDAVFRIWPPAEITRLWPRGRVLTPKELNTFAHDPTGWFARPPLSDKSAQTWKSHGNRPRKPKAWKNKRRRG